MPLKKSSFVLLTHTVSDRSLDEKETIIVASWAYMLKTIRPKRCARPTFKTLENYTSCVRKLHYDSGSRFDIICLDQMPSFKYFRRQIRSFLVSSLYPVFFCSYMIHTVTLDSEHTRKQEAGWKFLVVVLLVRQGVRSRPQIRAGRRYGGRSWTRRSRTCPSVACALPQTPGIRAARLQHPSAWSLNVAFRCEASTGQISHFATSMQALRGLN